MLLAGISAPPSVLMTQWLVEGSNICEAINTTQQDVDRMHVYDSNLGEKLCNSDSEVILLRTSVH